MEAMLATPIGRAELLAGKIVPYFALGMASMLVCTLVAVVLFGVPLRGSLPALIAARLTLRPSGRKRSAKIPS